MKASPAFFRSEAVKRLLDRAALVAATPMSLHFSAGEENELPIMGWGGCAVCQCVAENADGARACRSSRASASTLASQEKVPVTFVCHLGLTCVCVPALPETEYLITFGPYIPAEAAQDVAHDVRLGLRMFDVALDDDGAPDFTLDDVRIIPAGAVRATAEWLTEGLREAYAACESEEEAEEHSETTGLISDVSAHDSVEKRAFIAETVNAWTALAALALLCGHTRIVRAALQDRLDEARLLHRQSPESMQLLLTRTVSQILEASGNMGGDMEPAMHRYPLFLAETGDINEPRKLLNAAMRLLRCVRPKRENAMPGYLPDLVDIVYKRYKSELTLRDIAADFGVAASSITRALECRVKGSFTEYLGRVRAEHAQRMLRNTRLSAAAVGRRVGIRDQSNFGKLFERYVGMTPGAYRERYKKK